MSDTNEKGAIEDVEELLPAQNDTVQENSTPETAQELQESLDESIDVVNTTSDCASFDKDDANSDEKIDVESKCEEFEKATKVEDSPITDDLNKSKAPKRRMSVITISDSDSSSSSICHVESYQASTSEAKRMRGDFSSSSSSTGSSESESDSDDDTPATKVIHKDPSVLSTCSTVLKQRAPRGATVEINGCFMSEDFSSKVQSHWQKHESFKTTNFTFHAEPFRLCIMDEFLKDDSFINNIIDDMNTLDWFRKRMDLYVFHRTSDLADLTWQRGIKGFYDLLQGDIMKWVSNVTGLKLTHTSASCALYGPGDHLLVHDDLMADRKVAFIFYLAPWNIQKSKRKDSEVDLDLDEREEVGWTSAMGGTLDLYGSDDRGLPTVPVKSLLPRNNTFVFFKVLPTSFHKVSEVLSYDFPRLTINGWFHGPPEGDEPSEIVDDTIIAYKDLGEKPHSELFQTTLNEWISPHYLSPRTKFKIQQQIESESEISLEEFFLQEQYDNVLSYLQIESLPWITKTPCNLHDYQILPLQDEALAGSPASSVGMLLSSTHFMRLLMEYTELKLKTFLRLEIQRWTAASYSVLPHKEEFELNELDVILHLGLERKSVNGGNTIYLVPEEDNNDNALVTLQLKNNALNLIYSDVGTSKFTKYISKLSMKEGEYFYMIVCTFRE